MNKEEKEIIERNITVYQININTAQKHVDRLHKEIESIRTEIRANQRIVELLEKELKDETSKNN